ncbi:MAG TPA: pro-sigmaK processing inhibitor BofA family protein [Candidatus Thermoplasmatota archaeon]|nr:pro-sigmaK processing inhibitor BofA family protein [Candidatus Thermoplasmatota archaeon]
MVQTRRLVRTLVWNSILGVFILLVANALSGGAVQYPWWGIALSAVAGVPGALLTILLRLVVGWA